MRDNVSKLWEAIGRYGAEIATSGRMDPPQYLTDAVNALAGELPAHHAQVVAAVENKKPLDPEWSWDFGFVAGVEAALAALAALAPTGGSNAE